MLATAHKAKKYDVFILKLQKPALPCKYVWETNGMIRLSKQGNRDIENWVDELRSVHLNLTEKIMTSKDFVEMLLYNMMLSIGTPA